MKLGWKYRIGLLLGAAVIAGFLYGLFASPLDSDADAHRRMQTTATLQLVGRSLNEWGAQHGRVPRDDEALSVLDLHEYPIRDGWGRPLIYKAVPSEGGAKFQLRSAGSNGKDENGEGDDIILQFR